MLKKREKRGENKKGKEKGNIVVKKREKENNGEGM